ncbi:MAG: glycosyltransferase [Candidatus Poseidoniaceae archaeon]
MRILVLSGMHPLPTNIARGTFVADHVRLLRDAGHDVRVVNPLPRMLRYQESRRSTLAGVAKAPAKHAFDGAEVLVPRYWGLSNQASSWLTASSVRRRASSVQRWLDGWTPETVVVHALWPVGHLALTLARTWNVPCIGVVHGWDLDVGLAHRDVGPRLHRMIAALDRLVLVAEEQRSRLEGMTCPEISVISCHVPVEDDWRQPLKSWRGRWRRDRLDVLFPADPRRPEKEHYLALETGRELETRGWIVGMTTLRQQPRPIVWDRMMVASLTLITSSREAGPLVAKESIACGTPVASVDVGDVARWLPTACIAEDRSPTALADACERVLSMDWNEHPVALPEWCLRPAVEEAWARLLRNP